MSAMAPGQRWLCFEFHAAIQAAQTFDIDNFSNSTHGVKTLICLPGLHCTEA